MSIHRRLIKYGFQGDGETWEQFRIFQFLALVADGNRTVATENLDFASLGIADLDGTGARGKKLPHLLPYLFCSVGGRDDFDH